MENIAKNRRKLLYLITVLILVFEVVKLQEFGQAKKPKNAKFIGYCSSPTRIDPVDLTEVISKGNTSTITIREEWQIIFDEYVHWEHYLGKGIACFWYTHWADYTYYNYNFRQERTTTLPIFWTKLQKYLHLSEEELQYRMAMEKADKNWPYIAGGKLYGKIPDWDLILEDLGDVIEVDTSEVGFETTYYKDSAWSRFNTYCVVVETETMDRSVFIQLLIDGDSDIQLKIKCYNCSLGCYYELDGPKALLVETFEYIGLPISLLDSIQLQEIWDIYGTRYYANIGWLRQS